MPSGDKTERPNQVPEDTARKLADPQHCRWLQKIMRDTPKINDTLLSMTSDYWREAKAGLSPSNSLDGMLPASRALPNCPLARRLVVGGSQASQALLEIVRRKNTDCLAFRNALFVLMYFDSLFIYRNLKEIYLSAPDSQRKWIDVACRKIILRCLEVPKESHAPLTREIVRNTYQGRLATTEIVAAFAARLWAQSHRKVVM